MVWYFTSASNPTKSPGGATYLPGSASGARDCMIPFQNRIVTIQVISEAIVNTSKISSSPNQSCSTAAIINDEQNAGGQTQYAANWPVAHAPIPATTTTARTSR